MASFSVLFDGVVYNITSEKNMMGGTKYRIKKGKGRNIAIYDSFDKEPEDFKLSSYALELVGLIALDPEPLEDLGMRENDQLRFLRNLIEVGIMSLKVEISKILSNGR